MEQAQLRQEDARQEQFEQETARQLESAAQVHAALAAAQAAAATAAFQNAAQSGANVQYSEDRLDIGSLQSDARFPNAFPRFPFPGRFGSALSLVASLSVGESPSGGKELAWGLQTS